MSTNGGRPFTRPGRSLRDTLELLYAPAPNLTPDDVNYLVGMMISKPNAKSVVPKRDGNDLTSSLSSKNDYSPVDRNALRLAELREENEHILGKRRKLAEGYAKLVDDYRNGLRRLSEVNDLTVAPVIVMEGNFHPFEL